MRIADHNTAARVPLCESDAMTADRKLIHYLLCLSILVAPLSGCSNQSPDSDDASDTPVSDATDKPTEPDLTDRAADAWESSKEMAGSGWQVLTEKTKAGLVIAGEKLGQGKDQTLDASTAAWLWSKDKSGQGWDWVSENAAGAIEWASDSAADAWKVTRQESGEFALWVRVEVNDGVAWTKIAVPAAWDVTKDASGQAWVWVNDHKVEASIAAAMVAIVVGALIAAPEVVAIAAVRGAIVGGSSATVRFLTDAWENRELTVDGAAWSQDVFNGIGKSVLAQSGPQILQSLVGAESA